MCVNYYDSKIKKSDENFTVVVLLSIKINDVIVKYTFYEGNKVIFSSEYILHLPIKRELIRAWKEEQIKRR